MLREASTPQYNMKNIPDYLNMTLSLEDGFQSTNKCHHVREMLVKSKHLHDPQLQGGLRGVELKAWEL